MFVENKFPISVKAVIQIEGKIVLLKNERDEWELPGGRLEMGETPQECVLREINEELGINCQVSKILDAYLFEVISDKFVFIVGFECIIVEGDTIQISYEHTDFGLFDFDAINDLNLPIGYKRLISLSNAALPARNQ